MIERMAACCLALVMGCTRPAIETHRSVVDRQEQWSRLPGSPTGVEGRWWRDPGTLTGRLYRADACQIVSTLQEQEEVVQIIQPARGARAATVLGGFLVIPGTIMLVADPPPFFRAEEEGLVGAVGAMITLLGLPFLVPGAYYLARDPPREVLATRNLPPKVQTHLSRPCGSGPIVGLHLVVQHGGQPVATAVSDARGEVAFAIPPDMKGDLIVVVGGEVPATLLDLARPGEVVSTVPP